MQVLLKADHSIQSRGCTRGDQNGTGSRGSLQRTTDKVGDAAIDSDVGLHSHPLYILPREESRVQQGLDRFARSELGQLSQGCDGDGPLHSIGKTG